MKATISIAVALATFSAANPLPASEDDFQIGRDAPGYVEAYASAYKRDDSEKVNGNEAACTSVKPVHPGFSYGPTSTVFTSTSTVTETVDCGTCTDVRPSFLPLGVGPVVFFDTTTTAKEPSSTTSYVCGQPTPCAREQPSERSTGPAVSTATPPGVASPSCTTQTQVEPVIPDSTSTVYPSTVTTTSTVPCGSCALEWSTPVVNFFAPIITTTTITVAEASTKADLACSAV